MTDRAPAWIAELFVVGWLAGIVWYVLNSARASLTLGFGLEVILVAAVWFPLWGVLFVAITYVASRLAR